MTQMQLLMVVMAIAAFYNFTTLAKLAPRWSEAPAKALLALAAAVLSLLSQGYLTQHVPWLEPILAVLISLYALSGVLVLTLGRIGLFQLAHGLIAIAYWHPLGRDPLYQILAHVALQQGNTDRAAQLSEHLREPEAMQASIYAMQQDWQGVLALPQPEPVSAKQLEARVQALLAEGERHAAEDTIQQLEQLLKKRKDATTYRAYSLAQARLLAYQGRLQQVQALFRKGVPNTPPHVMLQIMAHAAEQAGEPALAQRFYRDGYRYAPAGYDAPFLAHLDAAQLPPKVARRHISYGTYGLAAAIALCYGIQLWLGDELAHWIAAYLNLYTSEGRVSSPWWRYLSYAFVHGNALHIGMNLWVLIDIGRLYEQRRNWGNLLMAFVFGSIMGAYITHIAQAQQSLILVGASGGILGIAGALLADVFRGGDGQSRRLRNALLQWIVLIVVFSLAIPNVSLEGHVGGLIGGLLWGFIRQGIAHSRRQAQGKALEVRYLIRSDTPTARRIDTIIGMLACLAILVSMVQMVRVAERNDYYYQQLQRVPAGLESSLVPHPYHQQAARASQPETL